MSRSTYAYINGEDEPCYYSYRERKWLPLRGTKTGRLVIGAKSRLSFHTRTRNDEATARGRFKVGPGRPGLNEREIGHIAMRSLDSLLAKWLEEQGDLTSLTGAEIKINFEHAITEPGLPTNLYGEDPGIEIIMEMRPRER